MQRPQIALSGNWFGSLGHMIPCKAVVWLGLLLPEACSKVQDQNLHASVNSPIDGQTGHHFHDEFCCKN